MNTEFDSIRQIGDPDFQQFNEKAVQEFSKSYYDKCRELEEDFYANQENPAKDWGIYAADVRRVCEYLLRYLYSRVMQRESCSLTFFAMLEDKVFQNCIPAEVRNSYILFAHAAREIGNDGTHLVPQSEEVRRSEKPMANSRYTAKAALNALYLQVEAVCDILEYQSVSSERTAFEESPEPEKPMELEIPPELEKPVESEIPPELEKPVEPKKPAKPKRRAKQKKQPKNGKDKPANGKTNSKNGKKSKRGSNKKDKNPSANNGSRLVKALVFLVLVISLLAILPQLPAIEDWIPLYTEDVETLYNRANYFATKEYDYERAEDYFLRVWSKDDENKFWGKKAAYMLGRLYYYGKKEDLKVVEWYERAAELGNIEAQYELGSLYWNGLGVERDLTEAQKWLEEVVNNENYYYSNQTYVEQAVEILAEIQTELQSFPEG